jgi:hypothetical protein
MNPLAGPLVRLRSLVTRCQAALWHVVTLPRRRARWRARQARLREMWRAAARQRARAWLDWRRELRRDPEDQP